jgi:hypothetical protein
MTAGNSASAKTSRIHSFFIVMFIILSLNQLLLNLNAQRTLLCGETRVGLAYAACFAKIH